MAAATIHDHLRIAFRLAGRDPAAIAEIANTPTAFWFSFAAAMVALPLYLAGVALAPERGADLPTAIAELGPYAVGWLLFPVVMLEVVKSIDRTRHYCRYIAAANWCTVIEIALAMVPAALSGIGVVPVSFAGILFIGVFVWVMMFQIFVARVGLQLDWQGAALIVGLRLILDIAVVAAAGVVAG